MIHWLWINQMLLLGALLLALSHGAALSADAPED
jgi:hypothetical protein